MGFVSAMIFVSDNWCHISRFSIIQIHFLILSLSLKLLQNIILQFIMSLRINQILNFITIVIFFMLFRFYKLVFWTCRSSLTVFTLHHLFKFIIKVTLELIKVRIYVDRNFLSVCYLVYLIDGHLLRFGGLILINCTQIYLIFCFLNHTANVFLTKEILLNFVT